MKERTTEVLTIGPFPNNRNGMIKFINAILAAGTDGYELPDRDFNVAAGLQKGASLRVRLHRYTDPILTEEDRVASLLNRLESKDKIGKADLLWLADKYDLTVPDELKVPTSIAKFLRDSLPSGEVDTQDVDSPIETNPTEETDSEE